MVQYDQAAVQHIERSYRTPHMAYQRIKVLEKLLLQTGDSVLDAGCGTGFLTQELAMEVGSYGRVLGLDSSSDMLAQASKRCQGLNQVTLMQGHLNALPLPSNAVDALSCMQVLLYVPELSEALAEMHRVLVSGGRIALVETDWRAVVLNSDDDALSRQILSAWDTAVPNPHLPTQLSPLLRRQGFNAVSVDAIPVMNTHYTPDNFALGALEWMARSACEQGVVSAQESAAWLAHLRTLGEQGEFFFCVNRFLFTAVK